MTMKTVSLHSLSQDELPKEWQLVPVGSVISDSQYGTNAASVSDGDIDVIGMKNIADGVINNDNLACTKLSKKELEKYLLKPGDVLINRTNSYELVGKVGLYASSSPAVFASYLVRLMVNTQKVTPEYLNYWLNSYIAQKTIKRIATRAISQANVNPTEFKKHCYMPLPPLGEQRDITEAISTCGKAVEITEQLIIIKQEQRNGLMQQLLSGKKRFPGFTASWERIRFSEIFLPKKVANGYSLDIEVLSVTKGGVVKQADYFNKEIASPDKRKYLIVERGDMVMSGLNFWMGAIDFQNICDKGLVSPAYKVFSIRNELIDPDYMRFFVRSSFMMRILIRSSVQGASIVRRNLDMTELNDSRICVPSKAEQKKIASMLVNAEDELQLLGQQLDAFKQQKRGLMQQLLTGKVRVKENSGAGA